jgi:hypothetical protein
VEQTGVPRENHRPVASHWQTLSHNYESPEGSFEIQYPKYLDIEFRISDIEIQDSISNTTNQEKAFKLRFNLWPIKCLLA